MTNLETRPAPRALRVNRHLATAAAYSWRLLAVGLFVAAALWLTGQLLVVIIPVAVATLLTRALSPLSARLRRGGAKPALAAAVTVSAFLVSIAAAVGFVGWAVAGELDELGSTLSEGVDDITNWLVEDGPFDVSRADVEDWREQAGAALSRFVGSGDGAVLSGAIVAGEIVVGAILAVIVTFFLLRDGRRFVTRSIDLLPATHQTIVRRAVLRAWDALGGYLRGAAILGLVESVIIGVTSLVVGADLVVPVMVVTFFAAFVPIVGAIVAGVIAAIVALVTAGPVPALIVAGVALVVQQLDNDLLAPVIYGRALRLHPLVILLGIAAGGSLFGFVGTVFAVPVLAVALNAASEVRDSLAEPSTHPTTHSTSARRNDG